VKKTIYLLNIDNYAPELTAITYPSIERYADRMGADIHVIKTRKFHEWHVTYEKLQIYELARDRGDDWALYIDSDALIHPELPDITELVSRDTVVHNGNDFAPIRWIYDDYFRRDGRHIGSCNWFTLASSWCFDLWRPLEDLTADEVTARIRLTGPEMKFLKPEHLCDDFTLSRNIARFGLKFRSLMMIWRDIGLGQPDFFYHEYLIPVEDTITGVDEDGNDIVKPGKVTNCLATLERWGLT
jgi:glycosyltransferase involved in cell wall biosynthesis